MLSRQDEIRIRHMLDAARKVLKFMEGRTRDHLRADEMLAFAVLRGLELIGEAAAHVSEEGRRACPQIPWNLIVGMRHRLIHGYYEVDLDRVWDTVAVSVPALVGSLESVLESHLQGEERDA